MATAEVAVLVWVSKYSELKHVFERPLGKGSPWPLPTVQGKSKGKGRLLNALWWALPTAPKETQSQLQPRVRMGGKTRQARPQS